MTAGSTGESSPSLVGAPTVGPTHWSLAPDSFDMTYIYVMECAGAFKVGITGTLRRRLRSIQLANPLPVTIVSYRSVQPSRIREVERQILEALRPYQIWGEWFRCPLDLVQRTRNAAIARNRASMSFGRVAARVAAQMAAVSRG